MNTHIQLEVLSSRHMLPAGSEPQVIYVLVVATPYGTVATLPRPPLNLCLVVDRSSSMRGERLGQVQEGTRRIIDQMEPSDFFSLVTFNDRAQVVIPMQRVDEKAMLLKSLVDSIEAAGGTEMATGIEAALHEMQRTLMIHNLNQIILLTDGRTYGDEAHCIRLARHAQKQGIGLTALGIGDEWNEDLLEMMTSQENAHTRYITAAHEIPNIFHDELTRMHSICARHVHILIEGHSDSTLRAFDRVQPFIAPVDYKGERNLRWLANLGDWPGTDPQAFLLELVVPPLAPGTHPLMHLTLRYDLPGKEKRYQRSEELSLDVEVGAPETIIDEVDLTVKHWLERLIAYRLQARAWKNLETGLIDQAAQQLQMAGTRLLAAGEKDLARTVQDEATRLLNEGKASGEGRKRIKFGTRGLMQTSRSLGENSKRK